jgi:hypothetical protein
MPTALVLTISDSVGMTPRRPHPPYNLPANASGIPLVQRLHDIGNH